MKKIAVIGGGITGLAVAYYLARENQEVTVFEKERQIGGLAAAYKSGQVVIDKYYRHIFSSHQELLETIRDLGLEDRLLFKKASMAYFTQGKIHSLNSIPDMLRFSPLSWLDRLRVGASASALLLKKKWERFDGMTAEAYLKKKCGHRGYRLFWEPLLKNKFGEYSSCISAAWFWDRLMSRARGRLTGSSDFLGYMQGGFEPLFARMTKEIEKRRGRIETGNPVSIIETAPDGSGDFMLNGDRRTRYHTCLICLPNPRFIDIFPSLPEEYRKRLGEIGYSHSVCMILHLKRPLGAHYWLNIGDPAFPFAVIVEHTNWMDAQEYGGRHIAYLSRYIQNTGDFAWTLPDHALFEIFCGYVKKIFQGFHLSDVLEYQVFRDLYTQPVFKVNYSRMVPPFTTPVKNLFLVNTSQFYPLGRCMNTSFLLAKQFISFWKGKETLP